MAKKFHLKKKKGSELPDEYQFKNETYYTHSGESVWKYLNGDKYYVKSDIHKISSQDDQKSVNQSLVKLLCEASIAQLQIEKRHMDEIDNISAFSIQKVGNADIDGNDAIVDIKFHYYTHELRKSGETGTAKFKEVIAIKNYKLDSNSPLLKNENELFSCQLGKIKDHLISPEKFALYMKELIELSVPVEGIWDKEFKIGLYKDIKHTSYKECTFNMRYNDGQQDVIIEKFRQGPIEKKDWERLTIEFEGLPHMIVRSDIKDDGPNGVDVLKDILLKQCSKNNGGMGTFEEFKDEIKKCNSNSAIQHYNDDKSESEKIKTVDFETFKDKIGPDQEVIKLNPQGFCGGIQIEKLVQTDSTNLLHFGLTNISLQREIFNYFKKTDIEGFRCAVLEALKANNSSFFDTLRVVKHYLMYQNAPAAEADNYNLNAIIKHYLKYDYDKDLCQMWNNMYEGFNERGYDQTLYAWIDAQENLVLNSIGKNNLVKVSDFSKYFAGKKQQPLNELQELMGGVKTIFSFYDNQESTDDDFDGDAESHKQLNPQDKARTSSSESKSQLECVNQADVQNSTNDVEYTSNNFTFWSILLTSVNFFSKLYELVFGSDDIKNKHTNDLEDQNKHTNDLEDQNKRTIFGLDSKDNIDGDTTDLGH